jgi:acyl carrier protein phosphodiesterase
MNYLGHIYFSNNNLQLAKANLFGDSVKGTHLEIYPEFIQKGIRLHREIDNYIDNHPKVLELIREIRIDLPKVAGIAIDLFFDHLLAKYWSDWNSEPLDIFLDRVHNSLEDLDKIYYPESFNFFIHKLCEMRWMNSYKLTYGLDRMCNGVSRRLSFDNELKNGLAVFLKNETRITSVFNEYMQDANEHFLIKG